MIDVRPAADGEADVVSDLLYETAGGMYDLFAGGRERAAKVLRAAYAEEGNSASREVVTVAELDGRIAGAMAAFPVAEGDARARAFLRLTLSRIPPWRCLPPTMLPQPWLPTRSKPSWSPAAI